MKTRNMLRRPKLGHFLCVLRACQPSEFPPEVEGMDAVFVDGGNAVALAQPEDLDQCIGRPVGFRQARHRRTDCYPVTIRAREKHIESTWNSHL